MNEQYIKQLHEILRNIPPKDYNQVWEPIMQLIAQSNLDLLKRLEEQAEDSGADNEESILPLSKLTREREKLEKEMK